MIKDPELQLHYVDGESFVGHAPIFSKDSQFVFIASVRRLYSYATKTGKRFIEFKGIDSDIVNFGIYRQDGTEFVLACTIQGTITFWKSSNGLKVRQTTLNVGEIKFFELFQTVGKYYVFLVWTSKENGQCGSGLLDINTLKVEDLNHTYQHNKKCRAAIGGCDNSVSSKSGRNQTFVAIIVGKKMLIDHLFMDKGTSKQIKIKLSTRKFTAIAAHPSEAAVLTGDNTGRVVLWQNIFGDYTQAVFHWHTLPVNTICFSSSGTAFFSGADECVLVKWIAEDPTRKAFLPRLSNCIQQLAIAPENVFLAVATKDNAIHIVDMQFNHVSILQELILGDEFPAGIHLDPKTRALVLNGSVGYLQFYSPHTRQLLYNLDVVGMNRITNERDVQIENTNINAVSISKNGVWMATVEERADEEHFEGRLKFWHFNETKQSFQLNTNVEYPHEGKMFDLKFQPLNKSDPKLVTIGEDRLFKVWQLIDITSVYSKGLSWRCASSGFYRDLTPTSTAFSYDGSLVAVAFESILTTWSPETIALKCSLLHSVYSERIEHMAFGTSTQCHLVVVASRKRLCVWNLLTLSLIWTVPLRVAHLVADPMSTHMAIVTQNNRLFVFEPNCEKPLYTRENLLDEMRTVMAAIMVPTGRVYSEKNKQTWHDKTQLYIIDSNKELHCFDTAAYDNASLEPMHFLMMEAEVPSAFSHLTPALRSGGEKATQVVHSYTQKLTKSKLDDLLEGSIHTMVPMRMIAHAIISSMIYQKPRQMPVSGTHNEQQTQARVQTQLNASGKEAHVDCVTEDLSKIALEPVTWTSVLI